MLNLSRFLLAATFSSLALPAAEPLSKSFGLDFFRDVPSRNLKGLATRSDGALVAGPVLTDLSGPALPELLWVLEPAGPGRWLVGTGPDGRIVEVTLDAGKSTYTTRDVVALEEPQVLALKRLPDGALLAGTSPNGVLALVRDGKVVSRVSLPADSIFDIAVRGNQAFVATGNPARIYAVDLPKFTAAGLNKERIRAADALEAKGLRSIGEVRDRNIRRLAWLGDRLIAGSSPKGNIYSFALDGGQPELLLENRDAEVAALLPQADGDLYAALVFTSTQGENRINRPVTPPPPASPDAPPAPPVAPPPAERFTGRSAIVHLPRNGIPETIVARANLAFYALARRGGTLLIAGGEQGDVLGYDIAARQSLSYAGSDSAQVNALAPIAPASGKTEAEQFLALRNNAPGLALIDFGGSTTRSAETRRLDLGMLGRLGALRIGTLREVPADQLKVELRTNVGSDEIEGWSPWKVADRRADGWMIPAAHARNVKLRLSLEDKRSTGVELDDAVLYFLPQNRRPQLGEFRILPAGFALIPPPESTAPAIGTLSQLITATERDERRRPNLTTAQVTPQPGMQIITWNVTDPDGDEVSNTFSLSRAGSTEWTDLVVDSRDSFVQFATTHFEDGIYRTRLQAREQAPRPPEDRLAIDFETPDLTIDNTPPTIAEMSVRREGNTLRVSVSGRDALTLLDGLELLFNNGHRVSVGQPEDGILDSQTETFVADVPAERVSTATSVEVLLADALGNRSARRAVIPAAR